MMHHNKNCSTSSLSTLQQQPSGSCTSPVYQCVPSSSSQQFRRPELGHRISLDEQLAANFNQNVSIFGQDDLDLAGLGVGQINPWQLSTAVGSTNGFTGSDSSAPLSPNSNSQHSFDPRRRSNNMNHVNLSSQLQRVAKNQGVVLARNGRLVNNQNANGLNTAIPHRNRQSSQSVSNQKLLTQQSVIPLKTMQSRSNDNYHCGMRDLTYWLKKLRLHKYTPLFETMTYPSMMALNNDALERMRVTAGARKKIIQSIDKLRERPAVLRNMEKGLMRREQCIRCAICSIRQMLWSPFMKYEVPGSKKKPQVVDGFNMPLHLIPDENMPALLFRLIELLNKMIFPMNPLSEDLEDEYLLTMFQIFDSVVKNDQFTMSQQRQVYTMKKNARNYASPEEMRKHRMGMVSSAQCERCHHAEVVNRDRMIELRERQAKQARGESISAYPACNTFYDLFQDEACPTTNREVQEVVVPQRVQQKRPADAQFDISSSTAPKTSAPKSMSSASSSTLLEDFSAVNRIFNLDSIWTDNNRSIWQADDQEKDFWNAPTTSVTSPLALYPEYRSPNHMDTSTIYSSTDLNDLQKPTTHEYKNVMNQSTFDFLALLKDMPKDRTYTETPSDVPSLNNKANSTGSGYSSSDSESSAVVSPRSRSLFGDTQIGSLPTMPATINAPKPSFELGIANLLVPPSPYSQYYQNLGIHHVNQQFM